MYISKNDLKNLAFKVWHFACPEKYPFDTSVKLCEINWFLTLILTVFVPVRVLLLIGNAVSEFSYSQTATDCF